MRLDEMSLGTLSCHDRGLGLDRFMLRLKALYLAMDKAYRETAEDYGCSCKDCDSSCCRDYFFHYTVAEYLYIIRELQRLDRHKQDRIRDLARRYVMEKDQPAKGRHVGLMCPLNEDGLCSIYPFRPMICRLHGVPHVYRRPDMLLVQGDGCPMLSQEKTRGEKTRGKARRKLDRTPFYRDMATLEKELRLKIGFTKRVKMTIADMILSF